MPSRLPQTPHLAFQTGFFSRYFIVVVAGCQALEWKIPTPNEGFKLGKSITHHYKWIQMVDFPGRL
jgi:hypothetical protein